MRRVSCDPGTGLDMDDLLQEFLTESEESLDVVDVELVKFEQDPNNEEILANIFRLVHTIKGTCGFLGLPRLEALAHAAETLMGKFRDGVPVTGEAVTVILASIDRIKEILAELEATEAEPEGADEDLISQLDVLAGIGEAYAGPEGDDSVEESADAAPEMAADASGGDDDAQLQVLERELKPGEVSLDDLERAFQEAAGPDDGVDEPAAGAQAAEAQAEPAIAETPAPAEPPVKDSDADANNERREKSVSTQSIRVNVDTLEMLMTMVSELVLTRNQLLEMVRRLNDSEFKVPLQRLSNVTAELQEGVMKTRMQPVGNAWQKLPRIIRDLSQELDKKINLVMNGAETELDRQVLDLIKDPLTHMVRNSADHGLEVTEDRIRLGKSETGTVQLSAYHEGGHIIIEIADDGAGLPTEKIRQKIIDRGLATEADLEKMSESQIHKFIFRAGFSTAENVTSVSGRGVGMDVVRTNIELIGGSVDVKSIEGQGSTFFIKIPLTLAIVSALIVEANKERFAVPQLNVVELVRVQDGSDHTIEMINDTPVLRLRNKLLPLVPLAKLLELEDVTALQPVIEPAQEDAQEAAGPADDPSGAPSGAEARAQADQLHDQSGDADVPEAGAPDAMPAADAGAEPGEADETGEDSNVVPFDSEAQGSERSKAEGNFIIVTHVGAQTFGIVVDGVYDTEEIVVKPMSNMLRSITMFSGNTILGDGSVILIVDPNGIAQAINSDVATAVSAEANEENAAKSAKRASEEVTSLLLFRAGAEETKAVPLSLVTRLEEIKIADIEPSNGRELVQYRGQLMPLVYVDETQKLREDGEQPVVVFSDGERAMGLVVDEIVDIVEDKLNIEVASSRPGIIGSAVVKGNATEMIDVGHYLPMAFDDWFRRQDGLSDAGGQHLLLVDDSAFFRNMLTPVLSAEGFEVVTVSSPREALELRENGEIFDLIVSDIEMPEMDGFEFAEKVRADAKWGSTPIIALSSHCTPAAISKAREAGFHDYVAKFDREGLVATVRQLFEQVGEAA